MSIKNKGFNEQVSKYLMDLMDKIKREKGDNSKEYKALYYQYIMLENNNAFCREENVKHYEATIDDRGGNLEFIERLYKRQAVIDITLVCSSHCRYCLRQNYTINQFTRRDIPKVINYCKQDEFLKELLITGGDPLIVPNLLIELIEQLLIESPNIEIIRIGTRLLVQDPFKVSDELYKFFDKHRHKIKFEIGMQVNHVVELQPKTCEVIQKFQEAGVTVYSQNVLLKNVNDNTRALIDLYDTLRYLNVESHYLFHAIPMKGTGMYRTSIEKGLKLIKALSCSGNISGRSKPMYSLMTDVGKITLYEGVLGQKDENNYYEVYTGYTLEDRKIWNPHYELPPNARIADDKTIIVKYLDGDDM